MAQPTQTTVATVTVAGDRGVDALTADGSVVRIRPVRADDRDALTDLHLQASAEARYRRFIAHVGSHAVAREVSRLTRAGDDHVALVAVEHGRIVGVGSYELLADRAKAEFSVFVDDAAHHRGI